MICLIKGLCRTLPGYKLLLTFPVFGSYISALVLAALAGPFRFDGRKQVIRLKISVDIRDIEYPQIHEEGQIVYAFDLKNSSHLITFVKYLQLKIKSFIGHQHPSKILPFDFFTIDNN